VIGQITAADISATRWRKRW